jgi:Uma2 family endonuclease
MGSVTDASVATGLDKEALMQRWKHVLEDRALRVLPYRIEMNKWGHIETTPPASPRHMQLAGLFARVIRELLGGDAFTECAIATPAGVKVADVVWCSPDFLARSRTVLERWEPAFSIAPDLCIEVMSPSNILAELEEKIGHYLSSGARECWIVSPDLTIRAYGASGRVAGSSIGVTVETVVERIRGLME